MLSIKIIKGLKNFFKSDKLSDRRLQIIEIEEDFLSCEKKRKFSDVDVIDKQAFKKTKIDLDSSDNTALDSNHSEVSLTSSSKSLEDNSQEKTELSEFCFTSFSKENMKENEEPLSTLSRTNLKKDQVISANSNTMLNQADDCNDPQIVISNFEKKNKDIIYSVFPIHSIILCVNSEFFQKLLVDSSMKETKLNTVTVKVPYGKGRYLEKLIEAFYNEDVLKTLNVCDLLQLINIAGRFSCTLFMEETLKLLNSKEINSVNECDAILTHLSYVFKTNSTEKTLNELRNSCVTFLTRYFFPLELKYEAHESFRSLGFDAMTFMMSSKHAITIMENHLFIFVYQWLLSNQHLQTPEVIETLLSKINIQLLTPSFLHDEVTICDKLLNIWFGYPTWFSNALKYHALSPSSRCLRAIKNIPINNRPNENLKYKNYAEHKFFFDNTELIKNNDDIVWAGKLISPKLYIKKISSNHVIGMKIITRNIFSPITPNQSFYRQLEFCYCILPGNSSFSMGLLNQSKFVQKCLRKADIKLNNKNVFNLHTVATLNEKYLDFIQKNGVTLVLFFKTAHKKTFLQYDWSNIKSYRKVIKLKNVN